MPPLHACIAAFAWLTTAVYCVHAASSSSTTTTTTTSTSGAVAACTSAQLILSSSAWQVASIYSGCVSYATSSTATNASQFTWPCSATDCTQELTYVAASLPECVAPGQTLTERAIVEAKVAACKSANASASTNSSNSTESKPTTETTTTVVPATSTSTSTSTPSPTKQYETRSCSEVETTQTMYLFVGAATSAECEFYSMVNTDFLTIFAPCTSPCVTQRYQELADKAPDCSLDWNAQEEHNKKEQIVLTLLNCTNATEGTSLYLQLSAARRWSVMKPKSAATFGVQSSAPHAAAIMAGAWLVVVATSSVLLMV